MENPQNFLMEMAWHDFVLFAFDNKEIVQAFEQETGLKAPITGIDRLIDDVTGASDNRLFSFARWVTERQWGMEYAPAAFRAECERLDALKQ